MTAAAVTRQPIRLQPEDLLDVLQPRVLLPALLLTVGFGLGCLYAGAGRWMLLAVVAGGCVAAVLSPSWGYVFCVFLFAFRNETFAAGEVKIADPLFLMTTLAWCSHLWADRRLARHWVLWPLMLYVCTSLLSGLMAHYPSVFLVDVLRLLYLVLILVLGLQIITSRPVFLRCVKAFLAAGLVMAVCSVLGFIAKYLLHGSGVPFVDLGGGDASDAAGRLAFQSIAVDPLRVSSFLIFPILVCATLEQRARTRSERWTASALVWLGIIACALSVSRSALLQLLPGTLALWWLTRRHLGKVVLLWGGTALGVGFLSLAAVSPRLVKEYRLDRYAIAGQVASGHTEPREIVWAASWKAFTSNPWLGVGLDNFKSRYMEFRDPWLARGWLYWNNKGSHSAYLAQTAETGALGMAAFLAVLASYLFLGRRLLRRARAEGNLAQYTLAVACYGAYIGQLVAATALELFAHNHVWVLLTLMTVLDQRTAPVPVAAATPLPLASGGSVQAAGSEG